MSPKQFQFITKLIFSKAANENKILEKYQIKKIEMLSWQQASDLIEKLKGMPLQEHANNELYGDLDPTRTS
jgi:hypothetical protein